MHFDLEQLASVLEEQLPEVVFCFLMGSAASGTVKAYSDLDLAFYLNKKPSYGFYGKAMDVARSAVPDVRCDIGILNAVEPVYGSRKSRPAATAAEAMESLIRLKVIQSERPYVDITRLRELVYADV